MICSSQSVPSARAVRADFFWQIHLEMKFLSAYFTFRNIKTLACVTIFTMLM